MTVAEPRPRKTKRAPAPNAIKLLKAEHREVEDWFDEFEDATSGPRKQKLARQICTALKLHTQIEEEIFYPACRTAGIDEGAIDEADVEHGMAKIIKRSKRANPATLGRQGESAARISRITSRKEALGGLFAKAKKAGLDLDELGEQMRARKAALIKRAKARH